MGGLRIGSAVVARLLGSASGSMILAASAVDLYDLHETFRLKKELYLIHQTKDSEVAYAYADFKSAVPMAALNLVLIGPTFLLKHGRLLKYVDMANFGMAGYMGISGYEAAEKLIFDSSERREAARKRAIQRAEVRERLIKERTGVE